MDKPVGAYEALLTSLVASQLSFPAPLQTAQLEAIRRAVGVSHAEHDNALKQAIQYNQQYSQCGVLHGTGQPPQHHMRAHASHASEMDAQPGTQEFTSHVGYKAWCEFEAKQTVQLAKAQASLPPYMAHLEVEVLQGQLLHSGSGATSTSPGCFSCLKPQPHDTDHNVAVSVAYAQAAAGQAQPHQTPAALGAVGATLAWRHSLPPWQVLQPDAKLTLSLMVGPANKSYLRCAGQVVLYAADLAMLVQQEPVTKHTITVPVFALPAATKKSKKNKQGSASNNRGPATQSTTSMVFNPTLDRGSLHLMQGSSSGVLAQLQLSVRYIVLRGASPLGGVPAMTKQCSTQLSAHSKAAGTSHNAATAIVVDDGLITTKIMTTGQDQDSAPGGHVRRTAPGSTWLSQGTSSPVLELLMSMVKLICQLSQQHALSLASQPGNANGGSGAGKRDLGRSVAHRWQGSAPFARPAGGSICDSHIHEVPGIPCLEAAVNLLNQASLANLGCELWDTFNQQGAASDMQSPFCASLMPAEDEPLPGGAYWSCLMSFCNLYSIRPPALRLCLLCHLLDNWPNSSSGLSGAWTVEIAVKLARGLMCLKEAKLLTHAESSLFESASGTLLRNCIDMIERHYEYSRADAASAAPSLKAALAGLHTIVDGSSGQELARKLVSFHVGTAVERRTRALLTTDKSALRTLANSLKFSHSFHAIQQEFADVSPELADWVNSILEGRSEPGTEHTEPGVASDRLIQSGGHKPHQKSRLGARTVPAMPSLVSRLTVAVAVVLEDLQMDVLLQPVFAHTLDLQAFTVNIRYHLLSSAVQLALATKPAYSAELQLLEDKLEELHGFLGMHFGQSLCPSDSLKGLADKLVVPSTSERQSQGSRGGGAQLQLLDIHTLMMPSVDLMIKGVGQRLLGWVDKIIELEVSGGGAEWVSEGQREREQPGASVNALFRPVSFRCRALYSSSVIELYRHLQAAVESVVQLVMGRGTHLQKASIARQLCRVVAAAVKRYVAHMERHCLEQMSNQPSPATRAAAAAAASAAPLPPVPCLSGSSSFRLGAAAAPAVPKHRRGRSDSAAFASSFSTLSSALIGVTEGSRAEIQGLSSGGYAGHQASLTRPNASVGLSATSGNSSGLSKTTGGLCITPELCVLLCSMEEVVQQQVKLEKLLLEAVRGQSCAATPQTSLEPAVWEQPGRSVHRQTSSDSDVSLVAMDEVVLENGQGLRDQAGSQALEVMVFGSGVDRLSSSTNRSIRGIVKHVKIQLCTKLGSLLLALVQEHRGKASPSQGRADKRRSLENASQVVLTSLDGDLSSLSQLTPRLTRIVALACWEAVLDAVRNVVCGQLGSLNLCTEELACLVKMLTIVMEALAQPDPSAPPSCMSPKGAGMVGLPSFKQLMKAGECTQQLLALAVQPTGALIQRQQIMCSMTEAASVPRPTAAGCSDDEDRVDVQGCTGTQLARDKPRPMDVLRLLQQRANADDAQAAAYWLKTVTSVSASSGLLELLLGSGAGEQVLMLEECCLMGCPRPGHIILCTGHLIFTTVMEDGKTAAAATDSAVNRMKAAVRGGLAAADVLHVPDVTLVMSLDQDVERVDTATHKASQALAIMAHDRSRHVLHGFKPDAAARVMQALRLHVMGEGTPLDKTLRGLDGGHGGCIALEMPAGESLVQTFTCNRYGVLSDDEGVLYLCTSMLVFDTDEQRLMIRYTDIDGLKMERDWKGTHWVQITSTCQAQKPLWLSPGTEQQALEVLTAIAAQGGGV